MRTTTSQCKLNIGYRAFSLKIADFSDRRNLKVEPWFFFWDLGLSHSGISPCLVMCESHMTREVIFWPISRLSSILNHRIKGKHQKGKLFDYLLLGPKEGTGIFSCAAWVVLHLSCSRSCSAVANRLKSRHLDLNVAGSNPPTAGQLPHLAPSIGHGHPSWNKIHIVISLIKKVNNKRILQYTESVRYALFESETPQKWGVVKTVQTLCAPKQSKQKMSLN